nr:flavodoxin [uncultured Acetatifactor sp.]
MEEYDLSDKTIIPFVTSGGSGFSSYSENGKRQYCFSWRAYNDGG